MSDNVAAPEPTGSPEKTIREQISTRWLEELEKDASVDRELLSRLVELVAEGAVVDRNHLRAALESSGDA